MNTRFYNAKVLQTNSDHTFSIANGELWVQGNEISYIGEGKGEPSNPSEIVSWDRELDCEGNLLIPGFKNAHTHTAMTFLRSFADDLPLQSWLYDAVFPREGQLEEDDIYWLDILGIMEYLSSGITSNFDMYFFPPKNAKASVDCGFRTVQTSGLNNFGGTLEIVEENYNIVNNDDNSLFNVCQAYILNVRSWLYGIHRHLSTKYLQGYLNEYFYRFNERNNKNTAFDKAIELMVCHQLKKTIDSQ